MKNVISLAIASENWIIIISLFILLAITLFIGSMRSPFLINYEGLVGSGSVKGSGGSITAPVKGTSVSISMGTK